VPGVIVAYGDDVSREFADGVASGRGTRVSDNHSLAAAQTKARMTEPGDLHQATALLDLLFDRGTRL
jgi:hypothetical protein